MKWQSAQQVEGELATHPAREKLVLAYCLRVLINSALFPEDYVPDPLWAGLLQVSRHGNEILQRCPERVRALPVPVLNMAAFCHFYWLELMFDIESANLDGLLSLLHAECRGQTLRWPYRNGRLLYDKFNDEDIGGRTDHLLPDDVERLLCDTPQGVYQTGTLVTGPLGVLQSRECRWMPPSMSIPLWHCSDTGCGATHDVRLMASKRLDTELAFDEISRAANAAFGPRSEFGAALRRAAAGTAGDRGRDYFDFPAFLGDAVLPDERSVLLERAIHRPERKTIAAALQQVGQAQRKPTVKLSAVVHELDEAARLQLLLMLSDCELTELLETTVAEKAITLPPSETRTARTKSGRVFNKDGFIEMSLLGLRRGRSAPFNFLLSVLLEAYEATGSMEELAWRMAAKSSCPKRAEIMEFLRNAGPAVALQKLVLTSAVITRAICDRVKLPMQLRLDQQVLETRLLWKLGFNPPHYAEPLQVLYGRLDAFRNTLQSVGAVRTETDRESVRSVGVNLFVAAEQFLESLLAFNVWLLGADHFGSTKFVFRPSEACRLVPSVLGTAIVTGDTEQTWAPAGCNSLGVLLAYLDHAYNWTRSIGTADRDRVCRPAEEMPFFAEDDEFAFPFRHVQLWADATPEGLSSYLSGLEAVVEPLRKSGLASVRNGLDHFRDEGRFPGVDRCLDCERHLRQAVDEADRRRFVPSPYWPESAASDRFGRKTLTLVNYSGRKCELRWPSQHRRPSVVFGYPYVIAPGSLLGDPGGDLVFRFQSDSSYSKYWFGYPRRRRLTSIEPVQGPSDPNQHSE